MILEGFRRRSRSFGTAQVGRSTPVDGGKIQFGALPYGFCLNRPAGWRQPFRRNSKPFAECPCFALVVWLQCLGPLVSGGDDGVGVGAPGEGSGLGSVVPGDEAVDSGLEVDDRAEGSALEAAPGELGEEALDGVQP